MCVAVQRERTAEADPIGSHVLLAGLALFAPAPAADARTPAPSHR